MKKITVIGGDNRLKYVKENLKAKGYTVDTLGLYDQDNGDIKTSQLLIFPVPTTKDKINVFTPLTKRIIPLEEIKNQITNEQLILTCNYIFENKKCIDYGALDSYALLNAVPTAEGAIKIAIENTPFTLWKSKILVIGYGRVGKILADRLKNLGCDVTVTARKPSDLALADALSFKFINTGDLNYIKLDFDIIINTVDVKILKDETLKKSDCKLIIELSTHGGFNMQSAADYGIKAIKAPGLPGIIAPQTAAEILSNTVNHIINTHN